jgi:hypothetical protein
VSHEGGLFAEGNERPEATAFDGSQGAAFERDVKEATQWVNAIRY